MQPLPRIDITQNMGWLSVRSQRAVFQVAQDKTELDISGGFPAVEMEITPPRVEIDQTASFASAGLKKPMRLCMDYFKKCEQAGTEMIASIARDGKEFVQIENKGNVIKAQAARISRVDPQLTIKAMPSVAPDINPVMGSVEITVRNPNAQFNWNRIEGQGTYRAADTIVSWLQKPNIEISVAGSSFDASV